LPAVPHGDITYVSIELTRCWHASSLQRLAHNESITVSCLQSPRHAVNDHVAIQCDAHRHAIIML